MKENNPIEKDVELKSNQILTNYIKEFNGDVKLNEFNLKQKSLTCSSIWGKWISYLFLEKDNLQRISNAKQKMIKKKLDVNRSSMQDSILKMKAEDKVLQNDEDISKLNILQHNTQECIDYIERALNVLSNFGFSIKNSIDVLKLQMQ